MKRGAAEQYTLNDSQIESLLQICSELEDRLIIKMALYCGLRASEICHLNALWLDGQGNIKIPASQSCDCGECKGEWRAKTKASARTIPIAGSIRDDLLAYLRLNPRGIQKSRITIWQRTKALMRRAGIRFSGPAKNTAFPHALRATCATLLAKGGMPSMAICYFMGWKSLSVAEHYITLAEAQEAASQYVHKIFG